MSCRCRAAPWRRFVRGLAQVHRLDAPTTALPLQLRSPLPTSLHPQRYLAAPGRPRALHASRALCQEAAAVAAAPENEAEQEPPAASSTETDMTPPKPDEAEKQSQTVEGKKKRGRKPKAEKVGESTFSKSSPKLKSQPKNKGEADANAEAGRDDTKPSGAVPANLSAEAPVKTATTPKSDAPSTHTNEAAAGGARPKPKREEWQIQKAALKEKFPEGWRPKKRLSPDALAGIRALNAQFPEVYTTQSLAARFEVAPEAIRRILKSKWRPSAEEEEERQQRWFRRGMSVWERKAALGVKPPKRWRREGVARDPSYHEWSRKVSEREREWEDEETREYREELDKRGGEGV